MATTTIYKRIAQSTLYTIGIAVFLYIIFHINLARLWDTVKTGDLTYGFFALATIPMLFLLITYRWHIILLAAGMHIGFWETAASMMRGLLWGELTPGRLGELYRAQYIAEYREGSLPKALATVVIDRLYDVLVLFGLAGIGVLLLLTWGTISLPPIGIGLIELLFVCLLLFTFKKNLIRTVLVFFTNRIIPNQYRPTVLTSLEHINQTVLTRSRATHVQCIFISLASWLVKIVQIFLLALMIHITAAPFGYFIIAVPLIIAFSLLPITISGLGTREAGFILLLSRYAVPPEQSTAISLLFLVSGFITIGIAWVIVYGRKFFQRSGRATYNSA